MIEHRVDRSFMRALNFNRSQNAVAEGGCDRRNESPPCMLAALALRDQLDDEDIAKLTATARGPADELARLMAIDVLSRRRMRDGSTVALLVELMFADDKEVAREAIVALTRMRRLVPTLSQEMLKAMVRKGTSVGSYALNSLLLNPPNTPGPVVAQLKAEAPGLNTDLVKVLLAIRRMWTVDEVEAVAEALTRAKAWHDYAGYVSVWCVSEPSRIEMLTVPLRTQTPPGMLHPLGPAAALAALDQRLGVRASVRDAIVRTLIVVVQSHTPNRVSDAAWVLSRLRAASPDLQKEATKVVAGFDAARERILEGLKRGDADLGYSDYDPRSEMDVGVIRSFAKPCR